MPERLACLAAFALGLAIVLTPVAARNAMVGGGFYLTTAQFGPNFFIGNNARADGTYMSLRPGRGAPEYERQDATEIAERELRRALTPSEVSSYWTGRAFDFIRSEPAAWAALMGRKFALLWNADEMLDTESQNSYAEWSAPLAAGGFVGHFGVLAPLALVGGIASWRRRSTLGILYALAAAYAASVVLFYVFARYRFPLVPFLVLFAASGVTSIPALFRTRSASRRIRLGVLVAATLVFCNWPLLSPDLMRAISETNLATALQEAGRSGEAIAHYERARQIRPGYGPAANNLGIARMGSGDLPGAIRAFRDALALQPDSAQARGLLADALYDAGSDLLARQAPVEAERMFREAMGLEPGAAETHNNLAIALAQQGKIGDAIAEWRRALEIKPDFEDAAKNLKMALDAR